MATDSESTGVDPFVLKLTMGKLALDRQVEKQQPIRGGQDFDFAEGFSSGLSNIPGKGRGGRGY